jgi:hypothetical protein
MAVQTFKEIQMSKLIKEYVTFYSPGTFLAETSTKDCKWGDVNEALRLSKDIKERYNATPYGFRFERWERGDDEMNGHLTERSGMYYLGGTIKTVDEIEKECDPKNDILIQNMRSNGYNRVLVNANSWGWTQPFEDEDILLGYPQ